MVQKVSLLKKGSRCKRLFFMASSCVKNWCKNCFTRFGAEASGLDTFGCKGCLVGIRFTRVCSLSSLVSIDLLHPRPGVTGWCKNSL